ncbi:hypothetical protein ACVW04_006445 [Bradyrhizobium sp. LM2.3]
MRAEALVLPAWPEVAELNARALHAGWLLGGLLLGAAAIPALTILNTGLFVPRSEEAPIIYRPPVEPLARNFVYFFALAPALGAVLISGLLGLDAVVGGAGVVLVISGLAVVVMAGDLIAMRRAKMLRMVWAGAVVAPAIGVVLAVLFLPWTGANEIATSMPARAISDFFDESFARRTNHRLRAVAGETQLASLITLHSGRPHLFIYAEPARTPWMNQAKFSETGGVVVWRASDTAGTPPPEILARFPGIVPEVPRAFEWLVTGRQQLLRIGWAIVRPKGG